MYVCRYVRVYGAISNSFIYFCDFKYSYFTTRMIFWRLKYFNFVYTSNFLKNQINQYLGYMFIDINYVAASCELPWHCEKYILLINIFSSKHVRFSTCYSWISLAKFQWKLLAQCLNRLVSELSF